MKNKLISIFFFSIFLLSIISAITIHENTQFQPTGTNTTFIMENNLTFDLVKVHSAYLKLNNNTISVNSSAGSVNITISNFTNDYKKFDKTASDSSATVSYTISNFTSGVSVLVTKNNVAWQAAISNSTGYISFDYAGSPALFELELGVMPSADEETSSSSGGGIPTYYPTESNLQDGYEKTLRKNWKMKFDVGGETHQLKVNDIKSDLVTITISSEPQTFDLSVNETKKLDLNSDGVYDLEVFLKDITGFGYWKKADLVVRSIDEEIVKEEKIITGDVVEDVEEKEEEEIIEEKNLTWLWVITGLVVVLLISVVVRYRKKK